jgi:hypothetical protein
MMAEYMSGYHAELWDVPVPLVNRQTPPIIDDA